MFHRLWMPSFTLFIEFNLNVNCVKRQYNTCYENFRHISVPGSMDAFLYVIYRIQIKSKICKDNNTCFENFHHIFVLVHGCLLLRYL